MIRAPASGVALALAFLLGGAARAGPWVRDPGSAYVKLGVARYTTDDVYIEGVPSGASYESYTASVYGVVGLPFQLQLVANAPFVFAHENWPGVNGAVQRSPGDLVLELDRSILASIPFSAGVEVKAPMYQTIQSQSRGGIVIIDGKPYDAPLVPDVGDANVDVTPKLLIGHSLGPLPGWIAGELGYRIRLGPFSNGVYAALNAGVWVWRDRLALGVYGNAVKNVDASFARTREAAYLQGYALYKLAPWRPELALNAGVGFVPWVRNGNAGVDVSFGISWER